jgi:hypothetical protein
MDCIHKEDLIKEALNTIVVDKIHIREADSSADELIFKYGIDVRKAYLCNHKYIIWGLFDIPYEPYASLYDNIIVDGVKQPIQSQKEGEVLRGSGYYPVQDNNLPFSIELEKPDENHYNFRIGKYELPISFEKTDKVFRQQISGYMGAGSWREYYETIDEPVKYMDIPEYSCTICNVRMAQHRIGGMHNITMGNIKVYGEKIAFDLYFDGGYNKYGTIYLSEEKKEIEINRKHYVLEMSDDKADLYMLYRNGVVIDANNKNASVFSEQVEERDPTALYVAVMERLLKRYYAFHLKGEKEALFTEDPKRAALYHGKTRSLRLCNGAGDLYLNTGFSTKSKWANVASVCKMVGVPCKTDDHLPVWEESSQIPKDPSLAVELSGYAGIPDPYAAFDRVYAEHPKGGTSECTQNYIEYKGCIYFLAYKKHLGKFGTRLPGMKESVTEEDRFGNWVAFGSIDLKTFKIEILKDYRSVYWKSEDYYQRGDMLLGDEDPMISISHDKIWYITYVRDDEDLYGADQGNLALKCLDIHTKEESVVMELPAITSHARMPIVIGNEFVYKTDFYLHTYNFQTKKSEKIECQHIMGYNQSWIVFLSSKAGKQYTTNSSELFPPPGKSHTKNPSKIFLLNVTDGSVCTAGKYLQDTLGVKEKISDINFIIDCKKKLFYVWLRRSSSYVIPENGVPKELDFLEGPGGSDWSWYFDWKVENVVSVGEECDIVQLEEKAIYLRYKQEMHKLFEFEEKNYFGLGE